MKGTPSFPSRSTVIHALIIANGDIPPAQFVRALARRSNLVVCADGGANAARAMKITPDVILGDFDSISASTRRHFHSVTFHHIAEQESTDLEKAFRYCIRRRLDSVDVVGATGGRIDHTIGALGCFRKFGGRIQIGMHDSLGTLTMVRGTMDLRTRVGARISLLPLIRCTGVTTKNLQYGLRNAVLEPGGREGISNRSTALSVSVTLKRGTLLVFTPHEGIGIR